MHKEEPILDLLREVEMIANKQRTGAAVRRMAIKVRGTVQGVGFRPFIYRLATEMGLTGWVSNSPQGLSIEAEGTEEALHRFLLRVRSEPPPHAAIQGMESSLLEPVFYDRFMVRTSLESGETTASVLPDLATCPDCVREIFDPKNRRYRHPFTNCTRCGPRFSIIESLPYDRPRTTMKDFPLCEACRREFEDPGNRRFHAQPNACPECGPQLALWDAEGRVLVKYHDALLKTAEAIREGRIVAVKGLGGYHLIADARNDRAVSLLRTRKQRPEKPFAVMYPSIQSIENDCASTALEAFLLSSQEAPIVLVQRSQPNAGISGLIAPGNPLLGIMLPYTPLHHLLMTELGFPVVATSGNRSEEPICTDEREAVERLRGIADFFLVHNRPIRRPVDDSVVRVMAGREIVVRRARGYAPLSIPFNDTGSSVLALGGHLKNTVAVTVGGDLVMGQHVGDLGSEEALLAFQRSAADLQSLYRVSPVRVACDLHPDYLSTKHAKGLGLPVVPVQHHHAHIVSCMTENGIDGPVLGVAWDGAGYGTDGTIWGGEFLLATAKSFNRIGHLRTFPLPGGERAIREPRRAAIGLLFEAFGGDALAQENHPPVRSFSTTRRQVLRKMLDQKFNAPMTSSVGRLFDAVASLLGLRQISGFEGQAAMELEFARDGFDSDETYPFELIDRPPLVIDWGPMLDDILGDAKEGRPPGEISATFHNTLAEMILQVARRIGNERVVLSGGCFQNRYLTEQAIRRLREEGFRPYWHRHIPPNDGGIALGQAVIAAASLRPLKNSGDRASTPKLALGFME